MPALTDITNSGYDTQCAAVPTAVGGVLTRVSDIDADPVQSPNSQIPFEATSASGITLFISYDQMIDTNVRDKIVLEAHGQQGILRQVLDVVAALDVLYTDNGFDPFAASDVDYMTILRLFQTGIIPILDSLPLEAWTETPPNAVLLADFSESFSDPTNTVTNDGDQEGVSAFFWDWGDGEISEEWDPDPHTYQSADTYTTRLIVIGPSGISIDSGAGNVVS